MFRICLICSDFAFLRFTLFGYCLIKIFSENNTDRPPNLLFAKNICCVYSKNRGIVWVTMTKIAIVDDNNEDSSFLEGILKRYEQSHPGVEFFIRKFDNAISFLDKYQPYDLVFMDIEMPSLNGMDACRKLREFDENITIIFVTNMAQFAVEGYAVSAFDFVVKPISYDSLCIKLDRALGHISQFLGKHISVKTVDGIIQIPVANIKYIDIDNYVLTYHTTNGNIDVTTMTLGEVEPILLQTGFFKINRGCLVNMKYIKSIKDMTIDVDGDELSLSRRRKKEFLEKLTDYFGEGNI